MGGTFVAEEWPESRAAKTERAGCTRATTRESFLRASPIMPSAAASAGARCSSSAARPRCCLRCCGPRRHRPERWKQGRAQDRGDVEAARAAFLARVSQAHHHEFDLHVRLDRRAVGGIGLRSAAVPPWRARRNTTRHGKRQPGLLGHDAHVCRDDPGCLAMPWMARRWGRRATLAIFFLLDDDLYRGGFRIRFLSRGPGAAVVHRLPVSFWDWAARISLSIPCGLRSSIRPSAGPAPSLCDFVRALRRAQALLFWWVPASRISARWACRWRSQVWPS